MPETWFTIRWPDDSEERCYSPSSIVSSHIRPGAAYGLADFRLRARTALNAASDRVRQKYGYPCSRAMAQLARIEERASRFEDVADPVVTCLDISSEGGTDG